MSAAACSRCGTPNPGGDSRFCGNCGAALPTLAEAAPALPVVLPALAASDVPAADPRISALLAGSRCGVHPESPASDVCSRCGAFACTACLRKGPRGTALCASCLERVGRDRWDVPWERRREIGRFRAWWQTAQAVLFSPGERFAGIGAESRTGDLFRFVWVAMVMLWGGAVLVPFGLVAAFMDSTSTAITTFALVGVASLVGISMAVAGRLWLGAGLDHLLLKLVGGDAPWATTQRAFAYSFGPAMFGLIPGCGMYVGELWRLFVLTAAYREAHHISHTRAAVVVWLPGLVVLGLYFGLFAFSIFS